MTQNQTILVVDDEPANLQKLRRTFINRYPVVAAGSGVEALEVVRTRDDIAVVIADQRMPDMTGIEFLRQTLDLLPHAIRIVLTGYTDVDVLMEAINSCKVFRYVVKPWDPPDLLMTVERGLEAYRLTVENERFRKELIRRERLARELEIAREIQRYILPRDCPRLDGYEMAVEYHPAREVGGDLYDFDYDPGAGELQVVIGDVSGKSIPAALYGAVFSGHIKSLFARALSPAETLSFLNENLVAHYQVNNYIAVSYLRLQLAAGRVVFANGGMPYPFLVRGGEVREIPSPGVPLGLLAGTQYDESFFELQPGEQLVLASDGATDALNPAGELYDPGRLVESIRRNAAQPLKEMVTRVHQDIRDFSGDAELQDDITILALRRR
jgi:serine phosphatase RsbU (regulator of sigma subunit)